jgi:peptide/nickel transport system substrate-binding protein
MSRVITHNSEMTHKGREIPENTTQEGDQMRKRTTKQFVAALIGSAALLLAACGGGDGGSSGGGDEDEGKPVVGGSISVGLEAEATGLRPWEDSCSAPCYTIMTTIFDKLMEGSSEGGYAPFLAESLEPNEGLNEWTLKLREGIKFHNGVALTSQTLVDMFEIQKTGAASSSTITSNGLTSVEVVDELTVVYKLSKAYASFPADLERAGLGMVFEPAAAAADSAGFSRAPVGTGPFTIQTRDPDNQTVVVKNADYWREDADGTKLPYLDQVTFRPIPDEGTRLDSVASGTVNLGQTLRQATIRDARATAGVVSLEFQGNNTGGGFFNTKKAPYDDVRVRMGLNMANNQAAVIVALGGEGISGTASQWFSPDSPWYSQKAADAYPKYDIEAATAKLKEYVDDPARSDGKPAGSNIAVTLSCPPDPTLIAAMQVVSEGWKATGLVDVELTQFDQATHINNGIQDNTDAHCWRWGGEGDPQSGIAGVLADPAKAVGNFPNWDGESAAVAIAAMEEAGKTIDPAVRKAAYETVMIEMNNNAVTWYSGHTATAFIAQPNIKGLRSWTLPSGVKGVGFPGGEGRIWGVWVAAS